MILRSTQAPAVGIALRHYLREMLGADVRFQSPPEAIPDGMEAYTFRFQLRGHSLPPAYHAPLVLRLYANVNGLPNLRHEYAVQNHMARRRFPVARPIHVEEDCDPLGGPFMLMECLPGIPLLESLFRRPWEMAFGPFQMGALHARLHRLPVAGFPAPPQPFLARWLNLLQERIDAFDLPGLQPGLDWLRDHRPPDPDVPSILHLDFHPINLLYHRLGITGVVDWPEADVGDPHADVATTLMLAETTDVPGPHWFRRMLAIPGPYLVRRFYLRAYGLHRRIDWDRLAYYRALAALRRLTRWGMWRRESPEANGCKPTAIALLADGGLHALEDSFRKRTGLAVRLEGR